MTWRIVHAAASGTSHTQTGMPCQDDHLAMVHHGSEEVLVGVVADGAGSALRAEHGAGVACETIGEHLKNWDQSVCDLTQEILTAWIQDVRQRIQAVAELENLTPRDFACTLLLAVVGGKSAVFSQIGDGGIVIGTVEGYASVFWPDGGEYANMTHFVTDDDALEHLQFARVAAPDELAMFSDGLQMLALNFGLRQAHAPFFHPMFERMRKSDARACDSLCERLGDFLNSPKVNERTDDDKTLILATRRDS